MRTLRRLVHKVQLRVHQNAYGMDCRECERELTARACRQLYGRRSLKQASQPVERGSKS